LRGWELHPGSPAYGAGEVLLLYPAIAPLPGAEALAPFGLRLAPYGNILHLSHLITWPLEHLVISHSTTYSLDHLTILSNFKELVNPSGLSRKPSVLFWLLLWLIYKLDPQLYHPLPSSPPLIPSNSKLFLL